jgi:hypothetical protein
MMRPRTASAVRTVHLRDAIDVEPEVAVLRELQDREILGVGLVARPDVERSQAASADLRTANEVDAELVEFGLISHDPPASWRRRSSPRGQTRAMRQADTPRWPRRCRRKASRVPPAAQMLRGPTERDQLPAGAFELETMRRRPRSQILRRIADEADAARHDVETVLREPRPNDAGAVDSEHRIEFMRLHEATMIILKHDWHL